MRKPKVFDVIGRTTLIIDNCTPSDDRIFRQALFRHKREEIEDSLHRTKDISNTVSLDEFYQHYKCLQDTDSYGYAFEFISLTMAATEC